jgi:spore coat polysaccharide biosynthesis protein SpsF
MKTVIIVQARMTSTRLPGKVLKAVLGKPLLEYQWERLRKVSQVDEIIIATTTNDTDRPIVEFCETRGIACFRGSEQDVLSRYYEAATKAQADVVVRVTSDCPMIDPEIVETAISEFLSYGDACDYLSNTVKRSYPRGLDVEVMSFVALEAAGHAARKQGDREHVTSYIYTHPAIFQVRQLVGEEDLTEHRWTVDEPADLELISMMLEALYPVTPNFRLADCLDLLDRHPTWKNINAGISQKTT